MVAALATTTVGPAIVADAGDAAAKRFLEFFAMTIRKWINAQNALNAAQANEAAAPQNNVLVAQASSINAQASLVNAQVALAKAQATLAALPAQ